MIDWDRVSALRDEVGAEDFDEVIEIFLEEVDGEIDHLPAGQPDGLAEKLHFLKGSAMNLGFSAFSDLCKAGETELSASEKPNVDLNALVTCYRESRVFFLNEVEERLSQNSL